MKYLANIVSLELFPERCVGCGLCAEVCPHAVFQIRDKKAVILDRDRCMECGACVQNCAFGALKVDKGVGCAAALINGMITGGEPSCDCSGQGSTGNCC
ncbi:MAG: mercury methylation ferredoxin HgcB [Thermodesulfovibrionales bacterium]